MAHGILELASLTHGHPDLDLNPHCMMAVIRLSLDPSPPVPLTPDSLHRTMRISHRPQNSIDEILLNQEIGWNDLGFSETVRTRMECTYNGNEITEKAAIAVMGLLVHELDGLQIKKVVPIGGGGDYTAEASRGGQLIQVEVSGIKEGHPSVSRTRLAEKCGQVLSCQPRG